MSIQIIFENITEEIIRQEYAFNKEEDLQLDFKLTNGSFETSDDRKNLAIALSGFANSEGGLIIWGINARKNKDGVDCSCGIEEIKQLRKAINRLNSLTGELVSPLVEGVCHKSIELSEDAGIIVTLIPASDSGPHMAKGRESRYYKRSGDSFYKMEHYDIEDMFGRRKKPNLNLFTFLETGVDVISGYGEWRECKVIIGIINDGRGIAKYPYISLKIYPPYELSHYGLDGNRNVGLPRLLTGMNDGVIKYGGNVNNIIHTGMILEITYVSIKVYKNNLDIKDLIIEYEICAENTKIKKDTKVLCGQDISSKVYPDLLDK